MNKIISYIKNLSLYTFVASGVFVVLIVSVFLFFLGHKDLINPILKYTLFIGAIPLWYGLIRDMVKGSFGVDLIAGVALISTFLIGQYLAGVIVLLMLSGGQLLEVYAMNRAKREMQGLLSRTPEFVHVRQNENVVDIPISQVTIGMEIVIKSGEVIAVDGTVIEGQTFVDESVLTGESIPLIKNPGNRVFAGTQNKEGVLVVRVDTSIHDTKFQSIVKLVREAQESKAPLVRLADKYSVYFTIITFIIAFVAWIISHDLIRVVSVLVVATPCPLILATPIAILSGMSKSSQRGIIIKDGGSLEKLSEVSTFVFDKTGTVTLGDPLLVEIVSFSQKHTQDDILLLATSLDQLSSHVLARALTKHTSEKQFSLKYPENFKEQFGDGVTGIIEEIPYIFGKRSFVESFTESFSQEAQDIHKKIGNEGGMVVFLASKDLVLGALIFKDVLRNDAHTLFEKMRSGGIKNIVLLTGDQKERADDIAKKLSISDVVSGCLPEDKVEKIKALKNTGAVVAMVGDGVNDAPALAISDVGIALGSHGKTAASDVADMVVLSQSISRVYDVWHIAKKTISLAKNGIIIGIGLSTILMICGAFGYINPVLGAFLQEVIDIIVILNALRLGHILKNSFGDM